MRLKWDCVWQSHVYMLKVWAEIFTKKSRKRKHPTNRFPYIVANLTHNNQQRSQQHRQARR